MKVGPISIYFKMGRDLYISLEEKLSKTELSRELRLGEARVCAFRGGPIHRSLPVLEALAGVFPAVEVTHRVDHLS